MGGRTTTWSQLTQDGPKTDVLAGSDFYRNPSLGSSLAHGQNTVSRILFQRRELGEFCGKLGEFCERLGEFAVTHTHTHKS